MQIGGGGRREAYNVWCPSILDGDTGLTKDKNDLTQPLGGGGRCTAKDKKTEKIVFT